MMKKILFLFLCCTGVNAFSQLHIGNGAQLTVLGNTTITLSDVGIVNNGSFNAGSGTVRFAGMAHADIEGSVPVRFHNLRLAKSVAGATISLHQDIEVSNEIGFGPGMLNLNDRYLDLGQNGMIVNEQENSRIYTNGTGEVLIRQILNAPVEADPGNIGVSITSSQNLGMVTISRGHISQTNGNGQGNSILRYYAISPVNNSSLNATVRLRYFEGELNGLDEATLMMWSSPNATTWTNLGYTSRDAVANYVEMTGINSLARFTLSSPANPLPLTGLVLSGRWENGRSELMWKTLTEFNNSHFDIERRYNDQQDFSVIGRRYSINPNGTSQNASTYYYTDNAAANRGIIYYRLQQADLDGRISYSNTIALSPGNNRMFISYVTNSGINNNNVFIQTGDMDLQNMEIFVQDAAGKIYLRKQASYESQQLSLPVMAKGIYYIRIISGQHQFVSPIIK